MTRPTSILLATSALLATAGAASADAIVRFSSSERPPLAVSPGSASPAFELDAPVPAIAAIAVSHGAAPVSDPLGSGIVEDVNLGEIGGLLAGFNGVPLSGSALDRVPPGDFSPHHSGLDPTRTPSVPVPPAAGLGGAALVAIAGLRCRRPLCK
jgi:hypothetical protein